MRFSFTGNAVINGLEQKNPYLKTGKTSGGSEYKSFSCGLKAAKNNSAWGIELFGMKSDTIKTMDSDSNKIDIDWDDRFDDDVIGQVASYKKNVIKINDDRKEFISPYDTVSYLAENIEDIKDAKLTITGQVVKNVYEGKISDRFQIQNVYLADEDDKCQFRCTDVFYYNKESFDLENWKDERRVYINGWINTYLDKNTLGTDKGMNKYVPHTIIFDCSKVDFENDKHRKLVNFKLKMIGCELTDDNKIKINLKKNVYKMSIVLNYNNGAVEEEFTEDMLSDVQKEAIELGIKTLDDFKSNVYGDRVTEYKLVDFNLKDDFAEGYIDTEITTSEFEEDIFVPTKEEKLSDVVKEKVKNDENEDTDEDDLFN